MTQIIKPKAQAYAEKKCQCDQCHQYNKECSRIERSALSGCDRFRQYVSEYREAIADFCADLDPQENCPPSDIDFDQFREIFRKEMRKKNITFSVIYTLDGQTYVYRQWGNADTLFDGLDVLKLMSYDLAKDLTRQQRELLTNGELPAIDS